MTLSDDEKRMLIFYSDDKQYRKCRIPCIKCGSRSYSPDDGQSMWELKKAICEKGQWLAFWRFSNRKYSGEYPEQWRPEVLESWRFTPATFFRLVVEWIKQKGE